MNNKVIVKFWGVRGSVPSPGPGTSKYGGNTSCVSIAFQNKVLILDAGTGIRKLGDTLALKPELDIYILLSHSHWDHIQGFPFFKPIYQRDRKVYMFPTMLKKNNILSSLVEQMDGAHFPVTPDQVPSNFNYITDHPLEFLNNNGFEIKPVNMNHPGSSLGYKIKVNGVFICYFTDNEIEPPYKKEIDFDDLVNQCQNADILIHDAQYTREDMPLKHGWGHSLVNQVTKLGHTANVKNIVYFHHDPDRKDEDLDQLLYTESEWLNSNSSKSIPVFAKEGLSFTF